MILLTKRNGDKFLVNHDQIDCIEMIPESKIVMMNHDFYLVLETAEEIVEKIANYQAKVRDIYREITITDKR
ncbi:MAG: flagellar FlbD family protein [Dorea sp.]|nr:flagellar FlbD family protein [Dorea sp.]